MRPRRSAWSSARAGARGRDRRRRGRVVRRVHRPRYHRGSYATVAAPGSDALGEAPRTRLWTRCSPASIGTGSPPSQSNGSLRTPSCGRCRRRTARRGADVRRTPLAREEARARPCASPATSGAPPRTSGLGRRCGLALTPGSLTDLGIRELDRRALSGRFDVTDENIALRPATDPVARALADFIRELRPRSIAFCKLVLWPGTGDPSDRGFGGGASTCRPRVLVRDGNDGRLRLLLHRRRAAPGDAVKRLGSTLIAEDPCPPSRLSTLLRRLFAQGPAGLGSREGPQRRAARIAALLSTRRPGAPHRACVRSGTPSLDY